MQGKKKMVRYVHIVERIWPAQAPYAMRLLSEEETHSLTTVRGYTLRLNFTNGTLYVFYRWEH